MDNAVRVDVEGHFDLGDAARRRRNAVQDEVPRVLLYCAISRSPATRDIHLGLSVCRGREDLALLVGIVVLRSMILVNTPPMVSIPRDSGVTSSNSSPVTSPVRTARLNGCADRDTLVGIDAFERLFPEISLDCLLYRGVRVDPPTSNTLSILSE